MLHPAPKGKRHQQERRVALAMVIAVPLLIVVCMAVLEGPRWANYLAYDPAEGDVLFQSLPRSQITDAIEGATHSPWSHCGIVARDERGRWIVYEALHGVEATPLRTFVARSREDCYAVYRWHPQYQSNVPAMLQQVRSHLGKPYDARYRLDDERIYCSELIYKAFTQATGETTGELVTLQELDWQPFQRLIEQIEGGDVPLDREIITPRDLAKAKQLTRVHRGNGLARSPATPVTNDGDEER